MTSAIDLDRYDGLGLAELVRTKELSAAEVLEAVIARAEARNPALNAIVTLRAESCPDGRRKARRQTASSAVRYNGLWW